MHRNALLVDNLRFSGHLAQAGSICDGLSIGFQGRQQADSISVGLDQELASGPEIELLAQ